MSAERLGRLLQTAGLITEEQLQKALLEQKKSGSRLGSTLVKLGLIAEDKLLQFLSRQYGIPSVDLNTLAVDDAIIKLVPTDVVQKYHVIPVKRSGAVLSVAMVDPTDMFAIDDIKFMTGYEVVPLVASEGAITTMINASRYRRAANTTTAISRSGTSAPSTS